LVGVTNRLFVYGTLQPGANAWHLLEPWATGTPRPAVVQGVLYDTGCGYPALRLGDDDPGVPGWVIELRSPSGCALSVMDSYEGSEYRRVLVTLPDGVVCWTYVWVNGFDGMRRLSTPWPARRE
jgi:gamma-glutamylcyclotransferase (GGCT)/AIG2-like uncharacterized protein YtfP